MRDAVAIIFLGALLGMTISATIGSSVLTLSGRVPVDRFATTWAVWWAGDAMGVLLVAPLLLSFLSRPGIRRLGWRGSAELAGLLAGVGVVTFFLFQNPYRLEYLVLPLIAIAAWRFRLRGAAPAALIASLIAVWAAVNGEGPFAAETLLEKMVTLQAFNVSVSGASFLLAAYADARQQREEMVRRYQAATMAITAKTDAIDVAAHELGPPVAVLTNYLAILYEGKLGPPPTKWLPTLRVMAEKAWQIDRIITDLVDAARIESQAPAPAQHDLRDAVRKAVERASRRLEVSGAKIATNLAADPLPIDADPRQIGRILDSLINNGLTYTVKPARLTVDAGVEGDRAVVHMVDNGVGISEEERTHLFEPFYRVKDPAFSDIPGVGLGLFASRKLAEVNHGRLVLERSEPGRGSTFSLDLPLAKPEKAGVLNPR